MATRSLSHTFSETRSRVGLGRKNIILYDGVCNFCNSCVKTVARFDTKRKFSFVPLQSDQGRDFMCSLGRSNDDLSSVVYVRTMRTAEPADGSAESIEVFIKSDAAVHVIEELFRIPPVLISFLCAILPRLLRDGVYDLVAKNRYSIMGKRTDCGCNAPNSFKDIQ